MNKKNNTINAETNKKVKQIFNPTRISLKWQKKWSLDNLYQTDFKNAKRPYYTLMMFPYPSAEGLHIGSIYTFTGVDAYSRFKKMKGYDVFEPFGLDAFGIHSENYALKIGKHPMDQAKITQEKFYQQMKASGMMIDWKSKLETTDPNYYKWTQWLFVQMFKHGLAVRKKAKVNFCPSCKTVLADEQVIQVSKTRDMRSNKELKIGVCERCGTEVEKRDLEQWFIKITTYADRLLRNVKHLDWSEIIKIAQENWIGEKKGIVIKYQIAGTNETIEIFTTRPDTNFGATFVAINPEHSLVKNILQDKLAVTKEVKKEIEIYLKEYLNNSKEDTLARTSGKTGVFSGLYAINQLTGYRMPIWISDFVLMDFGTGALVGVPGHDKRDFEFAKRFHLPIKRVIVGPDGYKGEIRRIEEVQEDDGSLIESDFLNDLSIAEAKEKIMEYMEERSLGKRVKTYHIRDWLISRQRYWGPPIPMIFCQACADIGKSWFTSEEASTYKSNLLPADKELESKDDNRWNPKGWYPVPENELPVLLPYIEDFKPLGTGVSPLANHPEFYNTKCPECGSVARRETDVSDTFLDSSWYFLRYLGQDWKDLPFPTLSNQFSIDEQIKGEIKHRLRFLPVAIYIGGAEHAVLHLLYARFVTMALHDMGYLSFEEPFSKFYAHGLIIKDGAKMSKSKGNVITPEPLIEKYGIDTVRLYLRFLGPFDQGGDFRDTGIEGMHKFVKRVYCLFSERTKGKDAILTPEREQMMHQIIKGITLDMEALRFNTGIAKLMTYYNFLSSSDQISHEEIKIYLQLLAPFAPHIAEELWEIIGETYSIHQTKWPEYNDKVLVSKEMTIIVQVNGKVRDVLIIPKDQPMKDELLLIDDKEMIKGIALQSDRIKRYVGDKEFKEEEVVYIPGKVINFIV